MGLVLLVTRTRIIGMAKLGCSMILLCMGLAAIQVWVWTLLLHRLSSALVGNRTLGVILIVFVV